MYQTIMEQCADVLLPIFLGVLIWGGVHYAFLTPRIIKVDLNQHYAQFDANHALPAEVRTCAKDNIVDTVLTNGRFEAALYTASLRHIVQPYQKALATAQAQIDEQCGVTLAEEHLAKQAQQAEELTALKRAENLRLETAKKAEQLRLDGLRKAEEIKREAERIKREQIEKTIGQAWQWILQESQR